SVEQIGDLLIARRELRDQHQVDVPAIADAVRHEWRREVLLQRDAMAAYRRAVDETHRVAHAEIDRRTSLEVLERCQYTRLRSKRRDVEIVLRSFVGGLYPTAPESTRMRTGCLA